MKLFFEIAGIVIGSVAIVVVVLLAAFAWQVSKHGWEQ